MKETRTLEPMECTYLTLSYMAARYEKMEIWDNAAELWQQASRLARQVENACWAFARADFCQLRQQRLVKHENRQDPIL
jgi:hypothetical protein